MKIIQPSSEHQLIDCANIYINLNLNNNFVNIDKEYAISCLIKHWRSLNYIKLIVDENEIVGYLLANNGYNKHNKDKFLIQEYYCSNLKGFKSARAVKLSHEDLINYAKQNKFNYVVSQGSYMDENHIFTKLLEKFGWERRGYLAKYVIK